MKPGSVEARAVRRPFRFGPRELDNTIPRRRVQRVLSQRFQQRIVVLVAGAGMGKTTALAVALSENRLAPAGIDIWLGCESADAVPQNLLSGLSEALGSDVILDVVGVCEAVVALAPQQVCLVLDDAHELGADSYALVQQLVEDLPATGHIVVSSRTDVPIPLARLEAQHQLTRLDPQLLLLSPEEVGEIYGPAAVVHGGWPALVSLAARQRNSDDFVWQEVVSKLSVDDFAAIQALVAIGPADLQTLEAASGVTAETLTSLPMVSRSDEVWVAHDLWSQAIAGDGDGDGDGGHDALRRRAIEHLSSRNAHEAIIDVALRSDSLGALALRSLGKIIVDRPPSEALCHRWLASAGSLSTEAEFEYLEGLRIRARQPSGQDCIDAFQRAADRFSERLDIEAEAASLGHVIVGAHVRRDIEAMLNTFTRIEELTAAGSQIATQISAVGGALLAFATNDPSAALEHLNQIDHTRLDVALASLAKRIEAATLNQLGRPSVRVALESQRLDNGIGESNEAVLWALVREGRWQEVVTAARHRPDFHGDNERFLWVSWHAAVLAALGDVAGAVEGLAEADACQVSDSWRAQVQLELLRCMVALCRGDEQLSKDIAAALVEDNAIDGPASALYLSAPRIVYDSMPDGPANLARLAIGPLHQRDLSLLQALNESRASHSNTPIRDMAWVGQTGELLTALQLDGTAEYLVRASAATRPEAPAAISWLFDIVGNRARDHVRKCCGHAEPDVAKAAISIIASFPIRPSEPRKLGFLGTSVLSIDGFPVESAQWRRERVRSLLGFLTVRRTSTRDLVMAALWPDVDEAAARRNLRTTLNLVHKCLEPARASGDAPYFVRSAGSTLSLIAEESLEVDVWSFESLLDEATALETDGLPSTALPLLEEAVEMYRGDLLRDVDEAAWIEDERHPLRRRYLGATVRLAQLHLALGQAEQAEVYARKAIQTEPWSEAGHCALITSLINLNDRVGAVRAARLCRDALDEIGGPAELATGTLLSNLAPRSR